MKNGHISSGCAGICKIQPLKATAPHSPMKPLKGTSKQRQDARTHSMCSSCVFHYLTSGECIGGHYAGAGTSPTSSRRSLVHSVLKVILQSRIQLSRPILHLLPIVIVCRGLSPLNKRTVSRLVLFRACPDTGFF